MDTDIKHLDFEEYLKYVIQEKKYVKIQYYTDIQEFITSQTIVTDFKISNGAEFLYTTHAENIKLDKVVKIDDKYAPKYAHIADFTCDC